MQSNMEQIFTQILSADNTAREQAEKTLEEACSTNTLQAVEEFVKSKFLKILGFRPGEWPRELTGCDWGSILMWIWASLTHF